MPAQWLNSSSAVPGRATALLSGLVQNLSQPEQVLRLRRLFLFLLTVWVVLGLVRLIWAFVPVSDEAATAPARVINPVTAPPTSGAAASVDIERLRSWHLFGKAGAVDKAPEVETVVASGGGSRDGIEKGARETRLNLILRGVVASSEDGLGHAIIENRSRQAVYAVGDKLPVSAKVTLAKVMPRQVVLDNAGTYELLVLFEDSKLGKQQAASQPAARKSPARASTRDVDKRQDAEITAMAQDYRDRLYKNPQSLANVVSISAVREGGQLRGYRLRPGKEREQFKQLGFKPGDLVTAVNGITLDNPGNTMSLYTAMRSAGEVVFDVERDNQQLTISVSLGE